MGYILQRVTGDHARLNYISGSVGIDDEREALLAAREQLEREVPEAGCWRFVVVALLWGSGCAGNADMREVALSARKNAENAYDDVDAALKAAQPYLQIHHRLNR